MRFRSTASVWLITNDEGDRISHKNEPGSIEFVPAKEYNDMIDWVKMDLSCAWKENEDGQFETECGNSFEFGSGGTKENGFKFCPYCQGQIAISEINVNGENHE